MNLKLKKVAIVGKPNVGKSQLFNRIVDQKHSIVFSSPGITRDRIMLMVEWLKYKFLLTDTGGYSDELDKSFQKEINSQISIAIKEADAIIFLISKKDGITEEDNNIAKLIKKNTNKPVILAINKCDVKTNYDLSEFADVRLGFGSGISISAEHGINIGELLDHVIITLNIEGHEIINHQLPIKFTMIGKPNVGKSSICNSLLKEERLIVSPVAGTTRDAVDINFSFEKNLYTLIDTPGIKKNKSLIKNNIDYYSVLRTKRSIKRANVICIVIDVSSPMTELDETIVGLAHKANLPTIIIGNKWDLIDYKTDDQRKTIENEIRQRIPFLNWAPIIFVSAKYSQKLTNIFKCLEKIKMEIDKKLSEKDLKNFLAKIEATATPPKIGNNTIALYKIKQVKSQIPTFVIDCNNIKYLHFSYTRMLENRFRSDFQFKICPIKFFYRSKKK